MKRKVKFFQITGVGGILYALDGDGQIWMKDQNGDWHITPSPEVEEPKYKSPAAAFNGA